MTVDLDKQLDAMHISPRIRQQIEEIRPLASERLTREAGPGGEGVTAYVTWFLFLFAGFLMAQERGEADRPATDAFNEFWRQYVTDLPPSPEKTATVMAIYEQGELTHGQAARMLGLTRAAFLDELGQHGLSPFQYDADDVLAEAGLR